MIQEEKIMTVGPASLVKPKNVSFRDYLFEFIWYLFFMHLLSIIDLYNQHTVAFLICWDYLFLHISFICYLKKGKTP